MDEFKCKKKDLTPMLACDPDACLTPMLAEKKDLTPMLADACRSDIITNKIYHLSL